MVQLDNIGHDKHKLFFLKWQIRYPTETYRINSTAAAIGSLRTFFVIEVTDAEYEKLIRSPQTRDNGLFDLYGVRVVSNRAPNTRTTP